MKITLHLIKAARKQGGDRYEADVKGEAKPWVVYFPQSISRAKGNPARQITLVIEEE